jgi:hypothetical protein
MGVIGKVLGGGGAGATALGNAVTGVAEVFLPNATRQMEASQDAYIAALAEHGEEFRHVGQGWFDQLVNGLNRMPRPLLALGTMGLFAYAMVDPEGFTRRMIGLDHVPDPLWWLLGAIVSFYFGAREAHYFRVRKVGARRMADPATAAPTAAGSGATVAATSGADRRMSRGVRSSPNAALDELRKRGR